MIKSLLGSAALLTSLAIINPGYAQDTQALSAIISGEHRSGANKARDIFRHPLETLSFFGIEPHHTVVEIFPGNGWYSEILAPYLRDEGRLIAAGYPRSPESSAMMQQMNSAYSSMLAARPDIYDRVDVADLHPREPSTLAQPGTVDFILDFRNAHNWLNWGADNMLTAWRDALKDGGMVGIVDHRMDPDREPGNGYIHEKTVIDTMEEYGFEFIASSEINANPRDTKDHPGGVWNLPPNLRDVPPADQAKFLAIGESDRMTMLFRKR